jgi:lysosomal alpha-glucosidase
LELSILFQGLLDSQSGHLFNLFYTLNLFIRNHNTKSIDQDPVALGSMVTKSAKSALEKRYSLLPYLYTLFYRVQQFGETVVRPLFFEFPTEQDAYKNDDQFLWGSSLMILPVLHEHVTKINAYFPNNVWYLYEANDQNISITGTIHSKEGHQIELDAPIDKINVAIRGGSILPVLPPKTTTTETRKQNFTLLVALDEKENAKGELFWDDGDTLKPIDNGIYTLVGFNSVKVIKIYLYFQYLFIFIFFFLRGN